MGAILWKCLRKRIDQLLHLMLFFILIIRQTRTLKKYAIATQKSDFIHDLFPGVKAIALRRFCRHCFLYLISLRDGLIAAIANRRQYLNIFLPALS